MNLIASRTRLQALAKDLLLKFEETKSTWHDVRSQEFERKYLQELGARVEKSISAIERLDQVLNKVRNDCE
jgi:hypothetical protein